MSRKANEIIGAVLFALIAIGLAFFFGTLWVRAIFISVCLVACIVRLAKAKD